MLQTTSEIIKALTASAGRGGGIFERFVKKQGRAVIIEDLIKYFDGMYYIFNEHAMNFHWIAMMYDRIEKHEVDYIVQKGMVDRMMALEMAHIDQLIDLFNQNLL